MARAVLALGANIGEPAHQIAKAIEAIVGHPQIFLLKQSKLIVSEPWGKTDQNRFHNGAVLIETTLAPLELLDFCLATEAEIGRVRIEKWGPRSIDIDVITYDDVTMESERLTLPHPYAHERDFVLGPVREIAPDMADWLLNQAGRKSA
ncbi:MAG TPA: 2-amino-4-hydroxy-6-hydroxymethyldihydropteridine diphosphokinase [Pelagibacterium sp.]|jgi:2-amino-4-hydroxy-6-hydroxymethyldihydropteridine diphosphokinase|uniref:2-amino-4-hydroxy-6- hydroxymethyldihydropteridine diphosphokinase n=1 Tax=uncultured Pelagibacterium sp. TaxID=1159875 RepID=UPI000C54BB95|nr:2-amino-4-hydroxy-6-hydroxymethyldihydropteridine diphosphokinase [Pelagibacterium sp.]HCO54051.1 2-amino-4-hydroxy-6-hydroxymethyldihydropteridine diphosphokinase [Pelagibacterium sp.]|tara:strand:+ start:1160 stop:1606 length:447 start_codon:yes stop_codon:yes gene_type:complete